MLTHAPRFDERDAASLARERYGIDGIAHALTSERDQNFLIESARGRSRIVLKIANALETPAMLEAQQAAMEHLGGMGVTLAPGVVRARDGSAVVGIERDGRTHLVWAITWLDGEPLANARFRSRELLEDLGRRAAELREALATFDHAAIHREFHWDLARAPRIVAEGREQIADLALRAAMDRVAREFELHVAPLLPSLAQSAVHGDLNDHNVLVGRGSSASDARQRIAGFVDYGDMVASWAIADLAIAIAYVVIDDPDPLATAAHIVRGHHAVHRLTREELASLWGLVLMRLSASACIAAAQQRERPDNDYLGVSQQGIRATLPPLATIPFAFAEATFRHACALDAWPEMARIDTHLRENAASFARIVDIDPASDRVIGLDLGVTSPLVSAEPRENIEPLVTERVFAHMRSRGATLGVGGYAEARVLYLDDAFGGDGALGERRTIHLGLDLFAEAGTPIHAPLDGVVRTFNDNAHSQDYGPVIILEHATGDGARFFTLYGHLSRESLHGVTVGQRIAAGERFASLGDASVNGGWTPHLHLQVMGDLLDLGTDFPGVARASEQPVWLALCPDPNLLVGVPEERLPAPPVAMATTLGARLQLTGRNLSIGYRDPVKVVRGWKQYLFDETGRRYLDAYNNVPHVGHCHPRIVAAAERQMRLLNTNTRYLSDLFVEYTGRLAALFPAPLEVCYLVNSASEANELALRLARAATGAKDMIVLDAAYHGNTTSLIDISPYKHAGPGGAGAPDWVHAAPLPDDYRGAYPRDDPARGAKYAQQVSAVIDEVLSRGRSIAAFIAETCPSVGGQLLMPPGYLGDVYDYVRAAGGLCIADEVQTGLGRMGTHAWAFEAHGVTPDIVVLGKPMGNGHPIGAVVTTRAIAESFDNGMEYFSTFGGNTVSCAVGLAVLDVLRDEGLQEHARRVGDEMLAAMRELMSRHEIVGDVRGSGLFFGMELVRDRTTKEPATPEASFVSNRMRERGVLLGTDGPWHNVVKIRPPMPFDSRNGRDLVALLDEVLSLL